LKVSHLHPFSLITDGDRPERGRNTAGGGKSHRRRCNFIFTYIRMI
jgi:hypothetical protein